MRGTSRVICLVFVFINILDEGFAFVQGKSRNLQLYSTELRLSVIVADLRNISLPLQRSNLTFISHDCSLVLTDSCFVFHDPDCKQRAKLPVMIITVCLLCVLPANLPIVKIVFRITEVRVGPR